MKHTDLETLLDLLTPNIIDVDGRLLLQSAVDDLVAPSRPLTRSAQRDYNRRFIVADLLDDLVDPPIKAGPEVDGALALVASFADLYAVALRARLARAFPSHRVIVEVIGAEAVDDEPLEVAVTFYQEDLGSIAGNGT